MRATDRLATLITTHSTAAIAVMLVATAIMGAGMPFVDQSPGLDQFEFDTDEGDALEYIEDNFDVAENETAVQIVIRDQENALSRQSFLDTLALQADLRDDPAINDTLTDDPVSDLAGIVATESIRADELDALNETADELEADFDALNDSVDELNESIDELENESDELQAAFDDLNESIDDLENESAELNASLDELEADADELEADAQALEERREQLEADEADLENRTTTLQDALEETAGIQIQYEQGELTDAEANAAISDTWTTAQTAANLTDEQNATFEAVGTDVREVASLQFERDVLIETGPADITDDPDDQTILRTALNETIELQITYLNATSDDEREQINATIEETWDEAAAEADLSPEQDAEFRALGTEVRSLTTDIHDIGPMPALFEAGTAGVLADDIADLEERGEALQDDAEDLEEREQDLEERGDELEDWGDELETRGEELEDEADDLEAWAEDLEDRADELEARGDALEAEGDALEERAEDLEDEFDAIRDIDPTLDEQRDHLESKSDEEVTDFVTDFLTEDADLGLFAFVPTDYDPGDTHTDARTLYVTQSAEEELVEGAAPDRIVDSQLLIADYVDDRYGEAGFTFGIGVITDEIDRSMADSLAIVLPLALLFVVVVLSIAYRDPLDIILGVLGIGLVLVWTFGFMGWTGIVFNQIMIAVPVLLVGLSIDYAIHVFMRHRERRAENDRETTPAMRIVLIGLGAALVWVTVTAVIGFLSNLVSPVAPIRDFGVVSAFGILATLLIFGILVPSVKITLDGLLEARGWDRRKRAFGTGGGQLTNLLALGNRFATRAPVAIVLIALLITAGGVFGATQVDTEFNQEDFIADEPAPWMEHLPAGFAPGEYTVKANLDFVNERFVRQDAATQVLIRGDITAADTLERIDEAETAAADEDVVIILSSDDPDVRSPLSSMQSLADVNDSFADTFEAADTTGDDVPDRNLTAVFDAYFDADPDEAGQFIARTDDGEYIAARMAISITGDASPGQATDATRSIAAIFDDDDRTGTATGQLVVFHVIEDGLFESVIESMLVTLVVVFAFLMIAYRIVHDSAILGIVTLLPIVLGVAWILGTMHLLDIPFNVITGTITSLTVGLGVAYNIHISERYRLELGNGNGATAAMHRAVTGTGGALLGSAATTIGGFGVLIFAILPPLQQFGLITGLTILYAFLGSVFVLPSLLALWTRYVRPDLDGEPA